MTPTAFTWPYWPLFAATIIWAYVPEFKIVRAARTAVRGAGSRDAGSFQMIVYAGGAASAIAVATGAYRILRHPSYAAGLLMNVGFGLALGNWASLALVALGGIRGLQLPHRGGGARVAHGGRCTVSRVHGYAAAADSFHLLSSTAPRRARESDNPL